MRARALWHLLPDGIGRGGQLEQRQSAGVASAYILVTCLFFAWGFLTSLLDPLVAAVKGVFELSDAEAQLSASAFFIAYGGLRPRRSPHLRRPPR